jgi:hypothetical protein
MLTPPSVSRRDFLAQCAVSAAAMAAGPGAVNGEVRPRGPAERPASPLAMWALTGRLKSDDVRRQLDAFHGAGWGVVLYPRWGLELEYLGGAWFERIRFIVEQAAARRMEVWLYDEFAWPSGHAKGLVTQGHEHLEAQLLYVERDGRSRIERVAGSANLLDAEATNRFLQLTHERYAAAVGRFFGSTVRAIFTDEPSLELQHRGRPKGETSWRLAWSAAMEAALGGEFRGRLARAGGDLSRSPLWRDYWAAYTRVFQHAWVAPIARWCEAHRIALTGHLLGEGSFGTQVAYNGSLRRQLGVFGIPGIDEIATRTEVAQCEAMTLAAIAEFAGRERMAEVYALGPPTMTPGTMRRMVELCAACGADRYVLAICPHDFRGGIRKREYFGIHGPQQPWFRECARIYTEFVAEAAGRARAAEPLGVPWPPDETLWSAAGPEPAKSPLLKAMSEKFIAAAREAIRARLEPGAAAPAALAARPPVAAAWTFAPKGLNSLRLDEPTLTIVDLPRVAELSVQSQLVRGLRINGVPVKLDAAPVDTHFDLSYRRLAVAKLLRVGGNRIEVDATEPKPLKFLPALILWGRFAVDAQGRLVTPPKTLPPGDWRARGYPALCGTGSYRAAVTLDSIPKSLCVDSGGYPARAIVNGKNLGIRAWTPFSFDLRSAAKAGPNEVIIEVTSTLGHLVTPAEAPPVGLLAAWLEG